MNPAEQNLSLALEHINLIWGVFDLWLVVFLAFYLNRQWRDGHIPFGIPCWGWPLATQAAFAIQVFHGGDFVVRMLVWYVRHHMNNHEGHLASISSLLWYPVLAFSTLAMLGILFKIKVFSQPRNWVWVSAVVAGLGASILSYLYF